MPFYRPYPNPRPTLDVQYQPEGPWGHQIVYRCLFNPQQFRGHLDYEIDNANQRLLIHTIDAHPQRQRLGSLLLFQFTLEVFPLAINNVIALLVAPNAYNFYHYNGFQPGLPGQPGPHLQAGPGNWNPFNAQQHTQQFLAQQTALLEWSGTVQGISQRAGARILNHWL